MVYAHFKEISRRFLSPFAGCTNDKVDSDAQVKQQKEYAHYVHHCFQNTTLRSHFPLDILPLFLQLTPKVVGFRFDASHQTWQVTDNPEEVKHGGLELLWDLYGFQPTLPEQAQQSVQEIAQCTSGGFHDRVPCTALVDQALGCTTANVLTTTILDGLYQNAIAWSILNMGVFRFYPVFQDRRLLSTITHCLHSLSNVTLSGLMPCRVLFYVPETLFQDSQLAEVNIHQIIQERQLLKETKLVDCLHQLSAMVMRYGFQMYIILIPFYARITPFSTSAYRLHYMFSHPDQFECSYDDLFIMKELLQVYLDTHEDQ